LKEKEKVKIRRLMKFKISSKSRIPMKDNFLRFRNNKIFKINKISTLKIKLEAMSIT